MRKILLLGTIAALAISATAWGTLSYRAGEQSSAMDIGAIQRAVNVAALPTAPVADYH
jgi:hypothetical protein